MTRSTSTFRHLPALDGLRGLALLGVLFFHAGGALTGGYLGVDLFFVLSGFLITSLLLAEQQRTGRIALGAFWTRRARRLFPALLSLMPAVALYGRYLARPSELHALRADALATLAYVANWRAIVSHKSYWDLFTSPSPLEHMWSLSIEEQFYLVWPLLVGGLLTTRVAQRRGAAQTLLGLVLALLVASVVATLWLYTPENTSRVYLGTDTRAAGILAGAALACLTATDRLPLTGRQVRWLDGAGLLSMLLLGVAWALLDGQQPFLYRGGLWLTELATLVLIRCALEPERSLVARILAWRPLRLVGAVSYGAYLWHWPIDVVLSAERTSLDGWRLQAVRFAVTFAVSVVSYRFLERPIRERGVPFGKPLFVVPAAIVCSVLLVVGATDAQGGMAAAVPVPISQPATPPPLPPPETIREHVLVFGDSTANSLGWGLRGVQRPGLGIELLGKDGCTLLADTCNGPEWKRLATETPADAKLVFVGGAFLHGVTAEGIWRKACHRAWETRFRGTLQRRLTDLTSTPGDTWLVTVPYPLGVYDDASFRKETDCINQALTKTAQAVPGVKMLDLAGHLCPKGTCTRTLDGKTIRPDGVHYDIDGANELSRWIVSEILPPLEAGPPAPPDLGKFPEPDANGQHH
jgi:peptidoglycan/LPS O-acetylase OafA/YrhL